jgi:hypothetical protein
MAFKIKTEAELTAMTPEQRDIYAEQKREFDAKATEKMITDILANKFPEKSAEEIEAEKQAGITAATEAKLAADTLAEVKETVNQLKENGGNTVKAQTILEVVKANKEGLEASTKKGKTHEFTIKAQTLRASVVGNPNALDLTDVGQLAYRRLTVYDMFRKVPVGAGQNGIVRYVDWDPATTVRAAAAIAEGAAFPQSTAKWATYTLALQKIGDIIPMSEELMYDAPQFAAELQNFLQTNVAIKIDTDLIAANGTSPNIFGLSALVSAYTPAASGITDANIYDLIVKVREAITSPYGAKYNPNVALMNIVDINKMKLKKNTQNVYIIPPFYDIKGNLVDGVAVMECNAVTANSMYLGDSRYAAIYEEDDTTVETGYATGDFESDMMSLKARKRLNLLIRTVDRTGWLKVTSISAALTTLAT